MSSHHIIREDQEPALLIMDAQAVSYETVQELLEWSPTVMVAEQALPDVLLWGIKIDVVIAATSSISALTASLYDQFPIKLISCNTQEETLSTALYFLIAAKQKAVNILSIERLKNFESFSSLDLSVLQASKRWSFIRNGLYEKWLPAGRIIHIYHTDIQSVVHTDRDGILIIRRDSGFWVAED